MAYILSLETATKSCSVALHRSGQLLAVQDFHLDKSHSSILHPLIRDMLQYCDVARNDLSAVAISMGPGSYTGLRIGTSAAKGLCFALDIPLIAVNTLEAMARQLQPYNLADALLCPMLDARRMEVYCQIRDAKGQEVMETMPVIIDESSFASYLAGHEVWFFGDGSAKTQQVLEPVAVNARFIKNITPGAASVGVLAWQKFQQQEFEDVAYFVPFYLKEFRTSKPKNQ